MKDDLPFPFKLTEVDKTFIEKHIHHILGSKLDSEEISEQKKELFKSPIVKKGGNTNKIGKIGKMASPRASNFISISQITLSKCFIQ